MYTSSKSSVRKKIDHKVLLSVGTIISKWLSLFVQFIEVILSQSFNSSV